MFRVIGWLHLLTIINNKHDNSFLNSFDWTLTEPQIMMLPPPNFAIGMMFSCWCAVIVLCQMLYVGQSVLKYIVHLDTLDTVTMKKICRLMKRLIVHSSTQGLKRELWKQSSDFAEDQITFHDQHIQKKQEGANSSHYLATTQAGVILSKPSGRFRQEEPDHRAAHLNTFHFH